MLGLSVVDQYKEILARKQAEDAAAATPIIKTAPKIEPANGPTLAPDGNGGVTPAFVPFDLPPLVTCVPGWTGPECKTRITDAGLPTGAAPAAPAGGATTTTTYVEERGGAAPRYEMQNGMPVLLEEKAAPTPGGFMLGPLAIGAAAVALILLARGGGGN